MEACFRGELPPSVAEAGIRVAARLEVRPFESACDSSAMPSGTVISGRMSERTAHADTVGARQNPYGDASRSRLVRC